MRHVSIAEIRMGLQIPKVGYKVAVGTSARSMHEANDTCEPCNQWQWCGAVAWDREIESILEMVHLPCQTELWHALNYSYHLSHAKDSNLQNTHVSPFLHST